MSKFAGRRGRLSVKLAGAGTAEADGTCVDCFINQ